MADKSFGVKELNLLNASGTPTVTSPNNLNLNANTVAISTSCTIGNNLTVTSTTNSANLNVTGIGTLTRAFATDLSVSGVTTITVPANANPHSSWDVVNNSASAYRFTGPGQDGAEDNPDIYLVRGQRYVFKMNASGHPFQIRVANGGAAYSDGVTNNGAQTGNVVFNVQHDAPAQLFYQCTSHGSMVGNIYIVGGPQVISGVVTATTFVGNLTGNVTGTASANAVLTGSTNNQLVTVTGANAITGESTLTYNGSGTLEISDSGSSYTLRGAGVVKHGIDASSSDNDLVIQNNKTAQNVTSNIIFKGSGASGASVSEKLRIGSLGQIGLSGANYGTSGQVLTSQGSGSAVQWASPVVAGSILQTVYGTTTNEIVVTSSSFQNFTALNTSITRMSSNSHLWVWINAVRLLVQSDSNEARVRITDGTSATTPYRLVNYDSDGNYLSFNPCLNWYWTKSHTAGTTVTITPQIRSINGSSNIVWGDNGDTSMMIIQEIAR